MGRRVGAWRGRGTRSTIHGHGHAGRRRARHHRIWHPRIRHERPIRSRHHHPWGWRPASIRAGHWHAGRRNKEGAFRSWCASREGCHANASRLHCIGRRKRIAVGTKNRGRVAPIKRTARDTKETSHEAEAPALRSAGTDMSISQRDRFVDSNRKDMQETRI